MPKIQKVRNWSEYNKSLKKRGAIILSFDEKYYKELYYTDKQRRGGRRLYSEKMYEYLLTLKIMFRLPWRAALGFAEVILQNMGLESRGYIAPDYAHASRECGKLDLKIRPVNFKEDGLEIAFDSTGVNVYSTSGWHQRKYAKDALHRKRDQWKKIHVAIDLNNMQVLSVVYTDSRVNDCEVVKDLCSGIKGQVKNVRADGAYDTEEFRKIIYEWGAQDLIPAAKTSKAQDELKKPHKIMKEHLKIRDEMIKAIRKHASFEEGLKAWKISSGYHRRSLVEAFMCRFKRSFGFNLQQKTDNGRINEIITKMNILNLMAALGKAEYSS